MSKSGRFAQAAEAARELRQRLHAHPEVSNHEAGTAGVICDFLSTQSPPDELHRGIGGHGVLALYRGERPGGSVFCRAELDALPIAEAKDLSHASTRAGVSHKCGHDGHMAILAATALAFRKRPARGTVGFLFQPAEETGEGALRVLQEQQFARYNPDAMLAFHNLPGYALGEVVLRPGLCCPASTGMVITLEGKSAHAAEPHRGVSPAATLAMLMQSFSTGSRKTSETDFELVTVVHARLGEEAFGTAPGEARLGLTLRASSNEGLESLKSRCETQCRQTVDDTDLGYDIEYVESFSATRNDPELCDLVDATARHLDMNVVRPDTPFPWSEDFGQFSARFPALLIGLGAGENQPPLHHPDYDFPDALLQPGAQLLHRLCEELLKK